MAYFFRVMRKCLPMQHPMPPHLDPLPRERGRGNYPDRTRANSPYPRACTLERTAPSPLSSPSKRGRGNIKVAGRHREVVSSPPTGRGKWLSRLASRIPSPPLGPELVAEGLGGEGRVRGIVLE